MKRYEIVDLQFPEGEGWWTWTKETPITKGEVLSMFRDYADFEGIKLPKRFDFNFIQDLWECRIIERS